MSTKLDELLEKQRRLAEEIAAVRAEERAEALQTMRDLMLKYDLAPDEVLRSHPASVNSTKKERRKAAPKFRDPATGKTWNGQGNPPGWIKGKERAAFLIQPE